MSKLQERLNHIGELVRGLSEQTSGNITIINSNCQMLGNRLEEIEKKVQELETKTASDLSQTVVAESATSEDQNLEVLKIFDGYSLVSTKEGETAFICHTCDYLTAIESIAKNCSHKCCLKKKEASEEAETENTQESQQPKNEDSIAQDFLWVARDKRTDTLYVYEVEPIEQYCETFAADDEEEKAFRIDFDLFSEVTFENSPQKLVLESSISKAETVEEGYDPTIDNFFYNRDKENSEKPNKQEFDKERALEFIRDIESCTIDNSNSATKAILLSCEELRKLLGNE